MRHISIFKSALSLGAIVGAWHAVWVVLVGTGWAGIVLKFILELHFIEVDVVIAPYSAFTAFTLVALTSCLGAVLGALFALVWNALSAEARNRATEGRAQLEAQP